MNVALNDPTIFKAYFANSGTYAAGLTVTVDIINDAGTFLVTAGSATDIGRGFYKYSYTPTSAGSVQAIFQTTGTVDTKHQPSLWVAGKNWVQNAVNSLPAIVPGAVGGLGVLDANLLIDSNVVRWNGTVVGTVPNSGTVTVGGYSIGQDPLTLITGSNVQFSVNNDHTITLNGSAIASYVGTGLNNQGYTNTRANYLDNIYAAAGVFALASTQSSILNAVNAITTNTARGKMVQPNWFVRPASSTATYEIDVMIYSLKGQLEDPDSNAVTFHARNASGTSLDASLSSTTMTRLSVGKFKVTYTVASTDAAGEIIFDATWAVGAVAMAVSDAVQVQDAETIATLNAINTAVAALPSTGTIQSMVTGGYTNAVNLGSNQTPLNIAASYTIPSTVQIAGAVLVNPTNKLLTNTSGFVTATNGGGGGGGTALTLNETIIADNDETGEAFS
jgi:hypothetical protein